MAAKGQTHRTDPIPAEIRTTRGSRKAQLLRAEGMLPGIVYGLKSEPVAISVPASLTTAVIHSGAHTADLVLNGKTEKVLIKAVQYDYLQTTMEHVDFQRVDPNQRVEVMVPLEFRGTPKGTKEGGILETQATEIEVDVKALEIPDVIRVNVENLELHGILHAKDIVLPEGAKLVGNPEKIIASVRTVKEEVAPEAAAGPAEPEVIGKKKEEEGAEGAAGAAPAKKESPKK